MVGALGWHGAQGLADVAVGLFRTPRSPVVETLGCVNHRVESLYRTIPFALDIQEALFYVSWVALRNIW